MPRSIIKIRSLDLQLVGTFHIPPNFATNTTPPLAVLCLNAGFLPRSSRGDLQVLIADHLAQLGYPTFRFDMPGLGDSTGDLPASLSPFFHYVQRGGHSPWIHSIIDELLSRYRLSGFLLLGHCGGAATAIHAAKRYPDPIRGLILLDPPFTLYQARFEANHAPKKPAGLKKNLLAPYAYLRRKGDVWLFQLPGASQLQLRYRALRNALHLLNAHFRRPHLPPDTNFPLVENCRQLNHAALPMLFISAQNAHAHFEEFDYIGYIQQTCPRHRITPHTIEGASHSFVEHGGKDKAVSTIKQWVLTHFPPTPPSVTQPTIQPELPLGTTR